MSGDEGEPDPATRNCFLKVIACVGVAFLALASGVENLVTYLFGPGVLWIVGGTYIAGIWAYETYCRSDP